MKSIKTEKRLLEIAKNDADYPVTVAAFMRLVDLGLIVGVANTRHKDESGQWVVEHLASWERDFAIYLSKLANCSLDHVSITQVVQDILKNDVIKQTSELEDINAADPARTKRWAVDKLFWYAGTCASYLSEIARGAKDPAVRDAATKHVFDQSVLAHVVQHDRYEAARQSAVTRLISENLLKEIAERDASQIVRDAAGARLRVMQGQLELTDGQLPEKPILHLYELVKKWKDDRKKCDWNMDGAPVHEKMLCATAHLFVQHNVNLSEKGVGFYDGFNDWTIYRGLLDVALIDFDFELIGILLAIGIKPTDEDVCWLALTMLRKIDNDEYVDHRIGLRIMKLLLGAGAKASPDHLLQIKLAKMGECRYASDNTFYERKKVQANVLDAILSLISRPGTECQKHAQEELSKIVEERRQRTKSSAEVYKRVRDVVAGI